MVDRGDWRLPVLPWTKRTLIIERLELELVILLNFGDGSPKCCRHHRHHNRTRDVELCHLHGHQDRI
jgi:hypothetical protein